MLQIDDAEAVLRRTLAPICEAAGASYMIEVKISSVTDKDCVAEEICQSAEKLEATAVVLARQKHSYLEEVFEGSVTKYCCAHCKHPVTVLH
ncbi:hypothetical protein WJX72_012471 [[Myrmecia] bisecta]|uniref:UspA domain-containing protein n=1 Tax=[Myrmecia] bisecta TaxID=41462 RepID=A0AAW1RAD3_9CHLO